LGFLVGVEDVRPRAAVGDRDRPWVCASSKVLRPSPRADALGGRVDDAVQRARDLVGRIADRRSATTRSRRFAGSPPCSHARASRLTSPGRPSCSPRLPGHSARPRRWPGSGMPWVSWRWRTAMPPEPSSSSRTLSTASATSPCRTSGPSPSCELPSRSRPLGSASWRSDISPLPTAPPAGLAPVPWRPPRPRSSPTWARRSSADSADGPRGARACRPVAA
jgi:hypothetical protein